MKLGRKLLTGLLRLAIVGLAGHSQKADDKKETDNTATTEQSKTEGNKKKESKKEEKEADDEVNGVSLKSPIKVGKETKKVTVLSFVNDKYSTENTRYTPVSADGNNGVKPVPTAYGTPEDFYNTLVEIGAKPGENMNLDDTTATHVEGSKISTTVTWKGAGKDYDINEVIKDSSKKKIEFRFGGNLERARTRRTGCLACLDSRPVGAISNTTYTHDVVEERNEVKLTGNVDVSPEDGTYVAVTYTLEG